MYYYSTKSTYRKSKSTIDILLLIMTAVIVVLFISIIFMKNMRGMLFPVIFVSGAGVNALNAAKNFINDKKKNGIVLTGIAIGLFVFAILCWSVTSRSL